MRAVRIGAIALLTLVLLAGCIGKDDTSHSGFSPLDLAQIPSVTSIPDPTMQPTVVATGSGGVSGVLPPTDTHTLNPDQLVSMQIDEMGVIPVLMYHAITTADTAPDLWTRTVTEFNGDLQWLYDHNFYVTPLRSLLNDEVSVPPGKHPVVLTFDDASAGQFQFEKDAKGDLVPTPTSTIGVMEAFFAKHPDFGHTGLFALLPYNCFSSDAEYNTIDFCDQKLTWLSDHGYEIANHTWGHQDLSVVDADEIASQIGQTMDFIDQRVSGPANLSRVLVLPYGATPDPNVDPDAWDAINKGFEWNGEKVSLDAVVYVSGGVIPSPASQEFDPLVINRFNTEPDMIDYWFNAFTDGDVTLYTSDGNPQTVVVPNDLGGQLGAYFDPDAIAAAGRIPLTYDPKTGVVSQAIASVPADATSVRATDVTAHDRDRVAAFDVSLR
ncbi:MAG: polysaccharide deacetylase family protein [Thermomicrobiales bacterium]